MKTFYLKYRPQKLEELDLENVRESLKKVVKSKKISHAFLFSGPKGTGKTSAARILAKIVNCESKSKTLRGKQLVEPCNKCKTCESITKGQNIDVIEIDAASHRGIDDIRSIREAAKLSTAGSNKKVYIIDEAHMLTTEASNALLKILEEPPEHVIFILATTNPEKLIDTIRSRAVNIQFNKATAEEIVRSLKRVAKGEGLKIDKDVLALISKASEGSFRDATKILEQLVSEKIKLNKESVEKFIYGEGFATKDEIFHLVVRKSAKDAIKRVEAYTKSGGSIKMLIEYLLECFRDALLYKVGIDTTTNIEELTKSDLIEIINLLIKANEQLSEALIEQLPLEVAIIKWSGDEGNNDKRLKTSRRKFEESKEKEEPKKEVKNGEKNVNESNGPARAKPAGDKGLPFSSSKWRQVLSQVKAINTSTEALLRATRPISFDGEILTLGVFYSFHKERLEEIQHRNILEEILGQVLGRKVIVNCLLTKPSGTTQQKTQKNEEVVLTEEKDEDIIKVAEEIFGN